MTEARAAIPDAAKPPPTTRRTLLLSEASLGAGPARRTAGCSCGAQLRLSSSALFRSKTERSRCRRGDPA